MKKIFTNVKKYTKNQYTQKNNTKNQKFKDIENKERIIELKSQIDYYVRRIPLDERNNFLKTYDKNNKELEYLINFLNNARNYGNV